MIADNYYGEIKTMEHFYFNLGTNTVFTLRANRSFIPDYLKETKNRERQTSRFLFTHPASNMAPVSLQSFIKKSRKNLLLGSTIHTNGRMLDSSRGLSCLNNFYNLNKCGVDLFDQMISLFTCKRRTYRWPLSLFYTFIDIARINSFTVASFLGLINANMKDARRNFMTQLDIELTSKTVLKRKVHHEQHLTYSNLYIDEMNKRLKTNEPKKQLLSRSNTSNIANISNSSNVSNISRSSNSSINNNLPESSFEQKLGYCDFYLNKLGRSTNRISKTNKQCYQCDSFTCKTHSKTFFLCNSCKENASLNREENLSV